MVGLAFSLCCLFLLHGFILLLQTTKKENTNSTYTNIFSIKNIVFFLTFSVLLADFHLLSSLSLVPTCPPSPPLHPHAPTSSPAVTKIDNFHASSITGPEWVYLLSFMVIVFTKTLENAVCYLQIRLEPLTHSSEVIYRLPSCTDDLSSYHWKNHTACLFWVCFKSYCAFQAYFQVNGM